MVPIYVDLDGSLIRTDSLEENLLQLIKKRPIAFFIACLWLLRGRAKFKEKVATSVALDAASLPYNDQVVQFLRKEHAAGRKLILATAAHEEIARKICDFMGIFSGYIATQNDVNLRGKQKLQRILEMDREFAYVGNAAVDLPIWKEAKEAIVVNAPAQVERKAQQVGNVTLVINDRKNPAALLLKTIRIHQWSKNVLLFMPLGLTPAAITRLAVTNVFMAFVGFSLVASSVYLLNDLTDIEADRKHSIKRKRPIAAGQINISTAGVIWAILLMVGGGLSYFIGHKFFTMVVVYVVLTTLYSFRLKKIVMLDVLILALLYTSRLLAGGLASGIVVSFWLLAFSWFFFASLALAKRSAELYLIQNNERIAVGRRGYRAEDLQMVNLLGVAFGTASIVVFSFYIDLSRTIANYKTPQFLWGISLVLSYWIGRLWILTGRGELNQDPVAFALKDRLSYVAGIFVAVFLGCAFFLK